MSQTRDGQGWNPDPTNSLPVGADGNPNVIKIRNYALMNRQGLTTPSLRATPP